MCHILCPSRLQHCWGFNSGIVLLRSNARAASARSFALWQQSNNRDPAPQSLYYCLFAPCIYSVFLCLHSVRGEPCISAQRQRSGCNSAIAIITKYWLSCQLCLTTHLKRAVKLPRQWAQQGYYTSITTGGDAGHKLGKTFLGWFEKPFLCNKCSTQHITCLNLGYIRWFL